MVPARVIDWRLAPLALLSICFLLNADGCPMVVNPESSGGSANAGEPAGFDLGGPTGALWSLSYEQEVTVTVRSGTEVTSTQLIPGAAPEFLSGQPFHLDSFCWRTDVVCPQQVLTSQSILVQPDDTSLRDLLLQYNRRGPLSLLDLEGLPGTLDGNDLYVPLAMKTIALQPCTLGLSSAIVATASASDGSSELADTLQGRITLSYSGSCVNLGATTIMDPDALLELSVLFVARREK